MILDKKHAMQHKLFRQFAEAEFTKELQEELDTTGAFNWDIHNKMAKYGFMGVKIPTEYGGAGGDYMSYVIMNEELSRQDLADRINAALCHRSSGLLSEECHMRCVHEVHE